MPLESRSELQNRIQEMRAGTLVKGKCDGEAVVTPEKPTEPDPPAMSVVIPALSQRELRCPSQAGRQPV